MTFFLGVAVLLIVLLATLLVWQHFVTTETVSDLLGQQDYDFVGNTAHLHI